ncbi:amidohydrolase [Kaistia dalseonensis]|nr:amidohydrolase [Kaistia dalseonensis]
MMNAPDIATLTDFRHELHRHPEVSGEEVETARRVAGFIETAGPDLLLTGLGGHGVAAIFAGAEPGPTLLIRSELDALPIEELSHAVYRSTIPGKGHLCGHDGHSSILAGLALELGRMRPARGRIVLLFQPAEEDGSGAAAVIADPRFDQIRPELALALHNMPGLPFGVAALDEGPFACASAGLRITLAGRTAHASMPETGLSPLQAVSRLLPALTALGSGAPLGPGFSLATVTHARMGEPTFGVAPGSAEIRVTLRAITNEDMASLMARAEALATNIANEEGLGVSFSHHDAFDACFNAPEATALLRRALTDAGVPIVTTGLPMRASEDFGRFSRICPTAMFLLGAGVDRPALHNPDYDFVDALIPIGIDVFLRAIRTTLGGSATK